MKKKKIMIVMPGYNAAKTLEATYRQIPKGWYNDIILVDDGSTDATSRLAKKLGITVIRHESNTGYGGAQKTMYDAAIKRSADIVVMIHPDNQYDPRIAQKVAEPLIKGEADVVLASRFLKDPIIGGPLKGGMPFYKFFGNRILTWLENAVLGTYFSEYHTGYRAYTTKALKSIPYNLNSNDFVFDNEIIIQCILRRLRFKEIPVETRYTIDASSISVGNAFCYSWGVLKTMAKYLLHKTGVKKFEIFELK